MNGLSLRFTLFGIPVSIEAFSWILLALLGGAFRISSSADVPPVLLFMVAGMICLIFHEMGHALVGRKLMGGNPYVVIGGLGGVTVHPAMSATRWRYFFMVLAGPLAGLLPGIIALPLMMFYNGDNEMVSMFFHWLLWVSIIWTILNLLPIFPLDGNKLLGTAINNEYFAAIVGIIVSALFLLYCVSTGSPYNILLSAYLAYLNFQNFKFIQASRR